MKKRKQEEDTGSEPAPKKRIKELQTTDKNSRENSPATRDKNVASQINGVPNDPSPDKTSSKASTKVLIPKVARKKPFCTTAPSPKKTTMKAKDSDDTAKVQKIKGGKPTSAGSPEKSAAASPKRTSTPPAKKKVKEAEAGSPTCAKSPKGKKKPDLQTISKNAKLKAASAKSATKDTKAAPFKKGKEASSKSKGKGTDIDEDEDSTDLDEDRKNIREAERALRSLSGEWEGSPPFFTSYDR